MTIMKVGRRNKEEVDTNDEEEGSVWLLVLTGRGSVDSVDWEG